MHQRYVPPRRRQLLAEAAAARRRSGPTTTMGGGGESCDGDYDCWVPRRTCPADDVTLVLLGKVGSGKSSTANSILGRRAFVSEWSYGSVTEVCQMGSTRIRDGCATRTINVIDTPGLFNMENKIEDSREDIIRCMDMARDGIHAMLVVFSATSRFSHEDEKTIEAIKMFFDDTIISHFILVFTNGDRIGENNWKKMLADDNCPKYLQDLLKQCKNRATLFDNVTDDTQKCDAQLKKLLGFVDSIVSSKRGEPFLNQMFARIKEAHGQKGLHAKGCSQQVSELKKETLYDEYPAQVTKMVEEKLNKTIEMMEKQLFEEKKARQKAEQKATEAMFKSQKEMIGLKLSLQKAQQDSEKARKENEKYRESETARREKDKETNEEIKKLKEKLNNLESEQQKKKSDSCIIL